MTFPPIKQTIVVVLFLCAVCFTLLSPINDPDFFWHLATGRWIAEHGELPQTDPFAYTTSLKAQEEFYRAKIILTQYWLANLLQYGIFSLAGFNGIIGLRVLIFVLTLLVIGAHLRKKGLHIITAVLLLLPFLFVVGAYKGDRPNQMTFLLLALFMYLADAAKRGEKKGYLLPLVFVIWANIHGGFLLGAAIAFIMGVSELLRKVFLRDHPLNKGLMAVMLVTLGAGFLNPNGYAMMYSMLFESSAYYTAAISETQTPLSFTRLGSFGYVWMLGISLFFAGWYFVSRIFSQSSRPKALLDLCDELLMVLFLFGLSCTAIRYIPLFAIVMVPVIAPLFSGRFQGIVQKLSAYVIPEILVAAISLWWIYGAYPQTVLKLSPVDPYFPDDAVQFIRKNEMKGRFYNYFDWGGYLIWQFYPEQFVFIDGRAPVLKVYNDSDVIMSGRQEIFAGQPLYRSVLDSFSIRHLIIPAVDVLGNIRFLLKALEKDAEWRLIFVGRNSLIYTRDPVEQDYPKTLSYVLAISGALETMGSTPDSPYPYLTYAKANSYLGRQNVAIEGLEQALRNRPSLRGGPVEKALQLLRQGKEIPINMQ